MKKNLSCVKRCFATLLFLLFAGAISRAQTLPYTFSNQSTYSDDAIYVAVVGIIDDAHVWIDCKTSTVYPMSSSYNTVTGPVYNGDMGPGGDAKYANCFTKLSEISNKTINIPKIAGCRILISFNQQLYLYFYGSTGSPSGYSAPNLQNPNDPNQDIRFEFIELSYVDNGLWCNTTRVDAYQYPMGLEVWGTDGFYKKVGELKTHDLVIAQWQSSAPSDFQGCLDATNGMIQFPTKTSTFSTSYFDSYIAAIWAKYATDVLVFDAGDAGTWKGSVQGGQFVFTRTSDGQTATITSQPTTTEVMEGSGVLASGGQWDKVVQAQFCAAVNRHALDLTIASGVTQDWSDATKYYQTSPYNWYAKFWHLADISYDQLSYAFCYDDVFNHSSTINATYPSKAVVTIGGFPGTVTQTPYSGTAAAIPGTIEAENYDYGGADVAYYDNDDTNSGGAYRSDGVDIESCTEGGYNMGWSNSGEWTEYTVNVASTGTYTVDVRVASTATGGNFHIEMDGTDVSGNVSVPNTGGWQVWQTVSATVSLTSGQHVMRYVIDQKEYNTNYFTFTLQGGCSIEGSTGDFSTTVSNDDSNPTLTFVPTRSGIGSTTCILYYSTTGTDPFPGYNITADSPYTISASNGQTVYFYYTYSLPEGGENNTYASKNSFTVGNCSSLKSSSTGIMTGESNEASQDITVFPIPLTDNLHVTFKTGMYQKIQLIDMTGNILIEKNISPALSSTDLDVSQLMKGVYYLRLCNGSQTAGKMVIK